MKDFHIMTTATLRVDLLKRTFNSFIENLFKEDIEKAHLILNIDMVGSNTPQKTYDQIIEYIATIPFVNYRIRCSYKPSFPQAFCYLLDQVELPYVFNLEEDWELKKQMSFERMFELFEEDPKLVHLRLSAFRSEGNGKLKTWNKFNNWNGKYYEVSQDLKGTIGWAGHPSLNKSSFLQFFRTIMDQNKNPEKQIKGNYPIIQDSTFGIFHPNEETGAAIYDIGRSWMVQNGYKKAGNKSFFTNWERI